MRCSNCDYQLWNLAPGACPECGKAFRPSEYEFRPNAVEFHCPHCKQRYFGTSPTGHLEPPEFDCVSCGRHLAMDEMVVTPAEGVNPEIAIRIPDNPWLKRERLGFWRAWWRTVLMGHVQPGQLAHATPTEAPLWDAWKFAMLNIVIVGAAGIALAIVLMTLMMLIFSTFGASAGGPGALPIGPMMISQGVLQGVMQLFVPVVYLLIWTGVTHAVLLLLGGATTRYRATANALLYTSGTHMLTLIPCVSNFAWIWWIVSAIIATKRAQATTGLKASIAVLTFPVTLLVLLIAGYIAFIAFIFSAMPGAPGSSAFANQMTLGRVYRAVQMHELDTGLPPRHALELIADGNLFENDVIHPSTLTIPEEIPVNDVTLADFLEYTPAEQAEAATDAADALPDDVIAHRLGDLVFTYHGFSTSTHPNLWIAILWPDSDADPVSTGVDGEAWVLLSSGSVMDYPAWSFDAELEDQNELRAEHQLPPLPHPADVLHDRPARAP